MDAGRGNALPHKPADECMACLTLGKPRNQVMRFHTNRADERGANDREGHMVYLDNALSHGLGYGQAKGEITR